MNKLKIFFFSFTVLLGSHSTFASSKNKKCLIESINYNIPSLNPHEIKDFTTMRIFDDIFEGLVTYNQQGDIIPGCAERWEISDDGKIYTFYIRQEAKWSNGTPLTAHDFVFSYQEAINPEKPTKYFSYLFDTIENAKNIRQNKKTIDTLGVKAIDDQTLQITLTAPNPIFLNLLCLGVFLPVYHENSTKKQKHSHKKKKNRTIGNGAYKVSKFDNGILELKKNTKYWDSRNVNIAKVKFLQLQDAFFNIQAFDFGTQAFDAGYVNITDKNLPPKGSKFYKKKYGDSFYEYPIFCQDILILNLENEKFQNIKVRKALTMAINKELYVEKILKFGYPSFNPISEVFGPEYINAYQDMEDYTWVKDKFDKRAMDANFLMEDIFSEEKPLIIKITYPIGTFYKNIAEFIQNSWEKIFKGIVKVEIEAKLEKDILEDLYKGDFEICLHRLNGFYPTPTSFTSFYVSDNVNNFSRYKNADFDKIFYQSFNQGKENLLQNQITLTKILLQDFVSIPLFYLPATRLISKDIGGFDCSKNTLDRYKTKDLYWINQPKNKKRKH